KPSGRRGRILVVNADREYRAGRTRNQLGEEHIEKIGTVCREWREVAGFSRIVTTGDVLADDANLNIRRWVDNTPPPEPQDVSGHLYGGIPAAEVDSLRPAFAAFGLDAGGFFVPLDDGYCDCPPGGPAETAERIEQLAWRAAERRRRGAAEADRARADGCERAARRHVRQGLGAAAHSGRVRADRPGRAVVDRPPGRDAGARRGRSEAGRRELGRLRGGEDADVARPWLTRFAGGVAGGARASAHPPLVH